MKIARNIHKFIKYTGTGGLSYAFRRSIEYFIFLSKTSFSHPGQRMAQCTAISYGRMRLSFTEKWTNILWNDHQIAKLNTSIETLGLSIDSTKARWDILEKSSNCLRLRLSFEELPLAQVWSLKINNEKEISWNIDLELYDWVNLDEFRVLLLTNTNCKSWFVGFEEGNFIKPDNNWHQLYLNDRISDLIGAKFTEGSPLSSLAFKVENKEALPLVQSAPQSMPANILGFRLKNFIQNKEFTSERYNLFSGNILLFQDDLFLDKKIEKSRQAYFSNNFNKIQAAEEKSLKIILTNLPWQRDYKWGVRAGSRWPHIKDDSERDYLPYPFFLGYAASLLKKHNFDNVELIDAIAQQLSEGVFLNRILDKDCDYLVAETSIPSFCEDLKLLEKIHTSGIKIILCGPNSEIYKKEFLENHSFIDFVLFGEYEFTLLELVESLQKGKQLSGIKGLIYREGNNIVKNPRRELASLDLLPWPEREDLGMDRYLDLPGGIPFPSAQMIASRGCPFGCNFCLWPQIIYQGNQYRVRNITDVVDEMEYLLVKKGFKSVYFDDDTFNIGKDRMLGLCREIKKRKLEKFPWAIMARADLMDKDILEEMKSAGLQAVKYGVETHNHKFIKYCNKGLDVDKNTEMIRLTKRLGIKTHLTFTFGFPGETEETIMDTIRYALSLEPDSVQFSILTPFPGTAFFEELKSKDMILTSDWSKYDGHDGSVLRHDNLTSRDLENAKKKAYLLWAEQKRRKRGILGDVLKFNEHLSQYGFSRTLNKTLDYLIFTFFKKKKILNKEDLKLISTN
ncbi:MAG: radical SAM protein [Candidatus Omnitrophica bacterium]|nr:radical SAM protein [Candidatus Omnitrophota bacterium]